MNTTPLAASEECRAQVAVFASILESIPQGICVYGPDRRVAMFNPAYAAIMSGAPVAIGDTLEDIARRRLAAGEFGIGDAAQRYYERVLIPTGPTVIRRGRPNGRSIEVRTTPLPGGGVMNLVTDVTAAVAAETELSTRAEAMGEMLANIRHGIVLWDAERRVVACNEFAEQMLGMSPGFLQPGRTLDETIDSALERGNLGMGEIGLRRAGFLREQDRSRSHADQRLTRLGRVIEVRSDPTPRGGFVTTYTDVTLIREAEVALRQAKATAEAANTGKSRFLAAMSHELRTPLGRILDESERAARIATDLATRSLDRVGPARIRDAARAAHDAGRTLIGVLDAILDLTRLEAGRFDLADDRLEPAQLVRACVRQSDPAAAAAEIALVANIGADLPPFLGDERRLRQVLGHLVANAVRFTGAMGSVSITSYLEPETRNLLIEVADSGIGIPDADLERVFEPFVRLDDGSDPGGDRATGPGLGLYVSRALMRAHGGDVTLQSRAGHGTVAKMLVPASRVLHLEDRAPI